MWLGLTGVARRVINQECDDPLPDADTEEDEYDDSVPGADMEEEEWDDSHPSSEMEEDWDGALTPEDEADAAPPAGPIHTHHLSGTRPSRVPMQGTNSAGYFHCKGLPTGQLMLSCHAIRPMLGTTYSLQLYGRLLY